MTKRSKKKSAITDQVLIENVMKDISNHVPKKDIANKYKISLGEVYKIYDKHKFDANFKMKNDANATVTETEIKTGDSSKENEEAAITKAELNIESIENISIIPIITTDDSSAMPIKEKPSKKKHGKITPEIRHGVIMDYFSPGKATYSDLAELYEISYSSVSRIISSYRSLVEDKKENVVILNNNVFDPKKIIVVDDTATVKLGLVADRHDMGPINDFVFESLDESLMFDYARQYVIAADAIKKHIDGGNKSLVIYATGLQSALTTVIKVCNDLNVPLTIMHYNTKEHTYIPQIVSESPNKLIIPSEFDGILSRGVEVNIYDCTLEDVVKKKYDIPEVTECWYDLPLGKPNRTQTKIKTTIFLDSDIAWQYFKLRCEEMVEQKSIFLNYAMISSGGKYVKDMSIARAMN